VIADTVTGGKNPMTSERAKRETTWRAMRLTIWLSVAMLSVVLLTGSAAANYTLTQPALTADITALGVTVASGLSADNKVYDGTTAATISSNNVVLNGNLTYDNTLNGIHAIIPEPSVLLLVACGAGAAWAGRRRWQSSRKRAL